MLLYNARKEWMAGCTNNSFSVASCSCRHLPCVHSWEVWAWRLSPVKAWASYELRAYEQTLSDDASLWFFQFSHHKHTKIDWMLGCSSQVQTLRFSEFSISPIFTVMMPETKLARMLLLRYHRVALWCAIPTHNAVFICGGFFFLD